MSADVRGIGQIHVSVQDVDRSVAFYRDVLGLPVVLDVPEQSMAFVDCGGVRLYLAAGPAEEPPSRPLLYLTVDAIDRSHAALRAAGADLVHEPRMVHRDAAGELLGELLPRPRRDPVGAHGAASGVIAGAAPSSGDLTSGAVRGEEN